MIIAGIVLFNPDKDILIDNINTIFEQVDRVILIDNGSPIDLSWLNEHIYKKNVSIIHNTTNMGIAYALNQIMQYGVNQKAEWVLTLDQDSVCPSDLIELYMPYTRLKDAAILSPVIKDRNNESDFIESKEGITEIKRCITSASFNNVAVWKAIGGFNDDLFIDYVDFEYCCRAREFGYKIFRVNNAILLHRLGNMETHDIPNKTIHVTNHSASRKYYYSRNACCCHRWHKKEYPLSKLTYHLLALTVKTIFFEDEKIKKLGSIVKGIMDSRDVAQVKMKEIG